MANLLKIVVLISGSGSNLQAIIDSIVEQRLDAQIAAVISNQANAYGLLRANLAAIPCHVIANQMPQMEADLDDLLTQYQPDLIVLAGFMRILPDRLVSRYLGKIINIHPALLPKYRGLHTHRRAIESGDTQHGSTIHYVIPELDAGPIIAYASLGVFADDTEKTLSERIKQLEHQLYPRVLQWFAMGKVKLQQDTVLLDKHPLPKSGVFVEL